LIKAGKNILDIQGALQQQIEDNDQEKKAITQSILNDFFTKLKGDPNAQPDFNLIPKESVLLTKESEVLFSETTKRIKDLYIKLDTKMQEYFKKAIIQYPEQIPQILKVGSPLLSDNPNTKLVNAFEKILINLNGTLLKPNLESSQILPLTENTDFTNSPQGNHHGDPKKFLSALKYISTDKNAVLFSEPSASGKSASKPSLNTSRKVLYSSYGIPY
jgi:hypothetical protein